MQQLKEVSDQIKSRAQDLSLVLMDVDGVLTDGRLFYVPDMNGQPAEFKSFNSQDGLGIHFLHSVGINTGVISGRDSMATTERARILKMSHVYQGHLEKVSIFEEVLVKEGISANQAAFIGDDFTDVPLIKLSGLGFATANARPEVKAAADYTTRAEGGQGAVREVAELILRSKGLWDEVLSRYGIDSA